MKLITKLITIFTCQTLVGTCVLLGFVSHFATNYLENQTKDHLEDMAFHNMDKIVRLLHDRLAVIRVIAADPALCDTIATPGPLTERLIAYRDHYNSFMSLSFFNLDRVRLADTAGLLLGEQAVFADIWPPLARGQEAAFGVNLSSSLQQIVVTFAAAVHGHDGRRAGVVVAEMPIERLNEILASASGVFNADDYGVDADLVTDDGLLLYSSHAPGKILREKLPGWDHLQLLVMSKEKFGSFQARLPEASHADEPQYIAFVRDEDLLDFSGRDWLLLLHIPLRTIMRPVHDLHKILLALLLAGLLVTIPLIVFIAYTTTRPLKKLATAAREIGQGNYAPEVMASSRDEIGALAESFRVMAKEIETARKGLETQVAERTAELQEALLLAETANRAKADFLGNVSHELVTPLNAVIGFAALLQDEVAGRLDDRQRECVAHIIAGGHRLMQLICEVLDMTRLESDDLDLHLSRFSLPETLANAIGLIRAKALTRGITLSLVVAPEAEIEIEADERRVKQILFNLLNNAVKFNREGGTVQVAARLLAESALVEITVVDTGIGISPEDIRVIFKPFKQLEPSLTKRFPGVGLGLAVMKRLVELHGGQIRCESKVGQGSTFTVVLPVGQGTEAESSKLKAHS